MMMKSPVFLRSLVVDVIHIQVQEADFDYAEEYEAFRQASQQVGAVVCFSGLVRDFNSHQNEMSSTVSGLSIEHYPGMTEKALQDIAQQSASRWSVNQVSIIHRVGHLQAGDQIVFVGVSSAHREEAFDACRFIMDYLKTQAPFWKKEHSPSGDQWVEAHEKDQQALTRWAK